MKILIAVDGTVHAHDAVKHLVEHLDWYREKPTAELVFVHLPLPPLPYKSLSADQIRRYYEEEGNAALAYSKNTLGLAGITYTTHILVGEIAQMIVSQATKTGCDSSCWVPEVWV
jgi:nucleotide-binding universal stress UspA family protein